MALIEWNDSLRIGIAKIDGQHRQLVQFTNDLNDAMKERKASAVLGEIIAGLIAYTSAHFGTEEEYFERFAYPERTAHKKEHAEFVQKVTGFQKDLEERKVALSIEVVNYLAQWLKNHIAGSDKRYAPFLNEHGVR